MRCLPSHYRYTRGRFAISLRDSSRPGCGGGRRRHRRRRHGVIYLFASAHRECDRHTHLCTRRVIAGPTHILYAHYTTHTHAYPRNMHTCTHTSVYRQRYSQRSHINRSGELRCAAPHRFTPPVCAALIYVTL